MKPKKRKLRAKTKPVGPHSAYPAKPPAVEEHGWTGNLTLEAVWLGKLTRAVEGVSAYVAWLIITVWLCTFLIAIALVYG